MNNEKFDNYISVDSHLETSGVNMVKEMCERHVGTWSVEEKKREGKMVNPNPNLSQT
jgi:hypothetical protein